MRKVVPMAKPLTKVGLGGNLPTGGYVACFLGLFGED